MLVLGGEIEVGGLGVALQLRDRAGTRYGDDVRMADQPGQGHLRRRGVMAGGDFAQSVEQQPGTVEVLWQEGGRLRAHRRRAVPRVITRRQQTLRERAVRDHHTVVRRRPFGQSFEWPTVYEVEPDLVGQDRSTEGALRGLPALEGVVAHPYVADLAAALEALHRRHLLGPGDHRVRPVELIEVHLGDAESTCAPRPRGKEGRHLERQEPPRPPVRDRAADDPLGAAETVDLRGIYEVHAEI